MLDSLFSYCLIQASWTIEGSSLPLAWPQRGTIEFQDYGLQYRKGLELALKGITLQIHEKERVSHQLAILTGLNLGSLKFLELQTVVEEVLRSFTEVKVLIPQCTLLQVKVLL